MASVTVKFDRAAVARRFDLEPGSRAQTLLDHQVVSDTDPYVPMDSGALKTSALLATDFGSGEVRYATPYAAAQYYGLPNKRKGAHPHAVMEWFEHSKAANKTRWIAMVKRMVR